MDMRGSGQTFGSKQSGDTDIGSDLRSVLLKQQIEELQRKYVLSGN